jgi:hypothetical protein
VDGDVRVAIRRRAALASLSIALACGCALTSPIVQTQVQAAEPGLLRKVAVVPFQPHRDLHTGPAAPTVSAPVAAELVTRFVAEALSARGVEVVAPNDLVMAFEAQGSVLPRGDAVRLAELAARQFGASAVVLGSVTRYHEREGGPRGALRPASVGFAFSLHAAPGGRLAYQARFDHTQQALSADLFGAMRYPGGGSRWLSAAELARWGAEHAVGEIPAGME